MAEARLADGGVCVVAEQSDGLGVLADAPRDHERDRKIGHTVRLRSKVLRKVLSISALDEVMM